MITGKVSGLDGLRGLIDRLRGGGRYGSGDPFDLEPLAEEIRQIIIDGNREGLLAGLDADGNRMADLSPATLKRGRSGSGPPTVPRGAESGLIAEFDAEIVINRDDSLQIFAGTGGRAPEAYFLNKGTIHMPPRKLLGIRPVDQAKIQQALNRFAIRTGRLITARF